MRERVAGVVLLEAIPNGVDLAGDVAQTRHDEIVLRAEVTIERHLVGISSLCDRVDPNPPDPVLAEKIAGGADDAVPRPQREPASVLHDFLQKRSDRT